MREGELYGLALEDIDVDEQIVKIRRQVKKLGQHFVYALPKNDRERTAPLPGWAAEAITRHIKEHPPLTYSLPWEKPTGKIRTHNLLFRWTDDKHIRARGYSELVWKPALVTAGVIPEPVKDPRQRRRFATSRREGLHQLRHFYASAMPGRRRVGEGACRVPGARRSGVHPPRLRAHDAGLSRAGAQGDR